MLAVRAALDGADRPGGRRGRSEVYVYGEGWNSARSPTTPGSSRRRSSTWQARASARSTTGCGTRCAVAAHSRGPADPGFGSGLAGPRKGRPPTGRRRSRRRGAAVPRPDQGRARRQPRGLLLRRPHGRDGDWSSGRLQRPAGGLRRRPERDDHVRRRARQRDALRRLQYKLPQATSMEDRVRMNTLSCRRRRSRRVSLLARGDGLLRSKSLDRNSFDSGDGSTASTGRTRTRPGERSASEDGQRGEVGLPTPAARGSGARADRRRHRAAHEAALELLEIRDSSPLFRLGTAERIQQRVGFRPVVRLRRRASW